MSANRTLAPVKSGESEQWLKEWVKLGEAATKGQTQGPTATEILAADRGRLESRQAYGAWQR
jgi:hypothetical protein